MNGKRITVTQGLRGRYAVMIDDVSPIRSGIGSYRTCEQAIKEAREWAKCEARPKNWRIR